MLDLPHLNMTDGLMSFVLHSEDLLTPHIMRAISNIKVTKIFSGCTAHHMVAIDGRCWTILLLYPYV